MDKNIQQVFISLNTLCAFPLILLGSDVGFLSAFILEIYIKCEEIDGIYFCKNIYL